MWGQKKFKRENIEVRNKSSLVELLSSFLPEREGEGHFLEERQYIVNYIKQLWTTFSFLKFSVHKNVLLVAMDKLWAHWCQEREAEALSEGHFLEERQYIVNYIKQL